MLNIGNTTISQASLHHCGNRNQNEGSKHSEQPLVLNDVTNLNLADFMLLPFSKLFEEYRFTQHSLVQPFAEELLHPDDAMPKAEEIKRFHAISQELCDLVYESGEHPQIGPGEVLVAKVNGVVLNDCICDGLCIVKLEEKENFLFTQISSDEASFTLRPGNRSGKQNKSVLILGATDDEGFRCFVLDSSSGTEGLAWREHFLGVAPKQDKHFQTKQLISSTNQFILDEMVKNYEVSKAEQAQLLQRTMNYLKANENFELKDFGQQVFGQPEIAKSFDSFLLEHAANTEYRIPDEFDISQETVKSQAKLAKKVIKLDKNFHLYVHGNQDMLERGFDEEKGMYFYKLFFREEM